MGVAVEVACVPAGSNGCDSMRRLEECWRKADDDYPGAKPAYYDCRATGGAWGSQAGLALETDEAPVAEDWLAAAVLVEAWAQYAKLLEQAAASKVMRERVEAVEWFRALNEKHFRPPERRVRRPVRPWGPGC